ncbi:MAG: D-aminoacyl-tRNA deacylase [Oscillospiraceae bacterium]|jgi:D-tyrosyl-tRNA(Tyr) deacylase
MKLVLQRVSTASVTIEGKERYAIGPGLVALVGFGHEDGQEQADYLAKKMVELRIFEDENGQMNRSLLDMEGHCLIVPNFTLYANAKKGRRPSFTGSMAPDKAAALFDYFVAVVRETVNKVETGRFGTHMLVDIQNDGPVTLILDTDELMPQKPR